MFDPTARIDFLLVDGRIRTSAIREHDHPILVDDQGLFRGQIGGSASGRCSLVCQRGTQNVPLVHKAKRSDGEEGPVGYLAMRSPRRLA